MAQDLVREYYSAIGVKEWRRLGRDPYHMLEFDTSRHFIKKHSPIAGLVLDAGGGPGRYTIELAKLGYDVVLLDLTPELLEIAKKQIKKARVGDRVKRILQGSIDNLSIFDDNTFDIVLCLGGALAHILDVKQREKAIDELIRVAKKNAPIFISVIGKFATLICAFIYWPKDLEINGLYHKIYNTGDYFGDYGIYTKGRSFAPCHFYSREELEKAFKKRNVKILEMVGLEGLATRHQNETNRLFKRYPKAWKNWKELHFKTCTHPSVVDISQHFMIICKK